MRVAVLLIGDVTHAEFEQPIQWLRRHADLVTVTELTHGFDYLAQQAASPRYIVLAQSYPGQFSGAAVQKLRQVAPLACLVGLLGSWCEGETRTGFPWPGVYRLYAHQFVARFAAIGLEPGGEAGPLAQLPAAAGPEQIEEQLAAAPLPRGEGLVMVVSSSDLWGQALADVCHRAGYACVATRSVTAVLARGVVAAIYDADVQRDRRRRVLQELVRRLQAPLLVTLDFPRHDECQQLIQWGAAAVCGKPLIVTDLLMQLHAIAAMPSDRRATDAAQVSTGEGTAE